MLADIELTARIIAFVVACSLIAFTFGVLAAHAYRATAEGLARARRINIHSRYPSASSCYAGARNLIDRLERERKERQR